MNKTILFILGILLVGTLVSAGVYINEVEFNNPGSDTKEFVELYNSGNETINISGWMIIDNDGTTDYIPDETFIAPYGFFVYDESLPEFTALSFNNEDNVTLKNNLGIVIDQTPTLEDDDDDNQTWQRVPDGTGNFIFKNHTKGETNEEGNSGNGDGSVTQNLTAYVLPLVHINEFEQNPDMGLDEWVELYNSGLEIINISGWKIYDGFISPKVIYNFPNESFIAPGDFLVVKVNNLDNGPEFVTLKDREGRLIDETPILSDPYYDNRTWQRVPDGTGDFVFKLETKNMTNVAPLNITNKSNITCAYEEDNITLSVVIEGDVSSVWFSYTINGTNKNITGKKTEDSTYNAIIPSYDLIGEENVSWNVYANNSINKIFNNSWMNFYVWKKTVLNSIPSVPDGLNGWYVTEPWFFFSSDNNSGDIYYRWNSGSNFNYTNPFNLSQIPNAPPFESAGILDLYWWAEFNGCGYERTQYKLYYVDLKDPEIKNLQPESNSVIHNLKPEISAYLDEVYQSNSGINLSSISIIVDGVDVTSEATISIAGSIDAVVNYTPVDNLLFGNHSVTISVKDFAGRVSSLSWVFSIEEYGFSDFELKIYSPNEGVIYQDRILIFNLTTSDLSKIIEYINWEDNNPRWKGLCRNCEDYGYERIRIQRASEGMNNLSIRAISETGEIDYKNISFFIDSKAPKIMNTLPRRNEWVNTIFEVQFREENPVLLLLYYGNSISGWKNASVNLSECYEERRRMYCNINVNLSDYDGEEIEYYFYLEDIAGNTDESRAVNLRVDTTSPVINSLNYTIEKGKVEFKINITEENLNEVIYSYLDNGRLKERKLCSRLNEGICEKRIYFREGDYNLTISAIDEAGNFDEREIQFLIDSKKPRIKRTEPRRGFADGMFYVEFIEENPKQLFLNYGNSISGWRNKKVNLSQDCVIIRYYECITNVNLSDYHGEEISYWFNITDIINQDDESRKINLDVDLIAPKINSLNYTLDGRKVEFKINITEENLNEVIYSYLDNGRLKERRLCSRLNEGICEKRIYFREGNYNLTISAIDEAGNFDEREIIFEVF